MKKLTIFAVTALLAVYLPKYSHAVGAPSTGSFTLGNVSALAEASAIGTLAVIDSTGALKSILSIGTLIFREGREWRVGLDTATSADNLRDAINAKSNQVTAAYSPGNTVITLTAVDIGTFYNTVGLRSSTPTALSVSGTFLTGGQDNASLSINRIPLVQGRDWFIQDVASNTAINLAAGINNSPGLNNTVEAVWLGGSSAVVFLRASLSPVAYTLSSTAPGDLTPSGPTMTGGSAGNLARSLCFLGTVNELPSNNYPEGCMLYLSSDPTQIYISTKPVTNVEAWSPIAVSATGLSVLKTGDTMTGQLTISGANLTVDGNIQGLAGTFTQLHSTGPITGSLTGNADTATDLTASVPCPSGFVSRGIQTDGTAICVQVLDATIDGSTLPATSNILFDHAAFTGSSAHGATSANTASQIVTRDVTGSFEAGTVTATITGASSLNVLKTGDTMTGQLTLANSTLTVRGVGDVLWVESTSGNGGIQIHVPATKNARIKFFQNKVLEWVITNQGTDRTLKIQDGLFSTKVAIKQPSGNFGLSTLNPTHLFDVNGGAVFRSSVTLADLIEGSVLFAGAGSSITQNNTQFFWDDANTRLGIANSGTPQYRLDVGNNSYWALNGNFAHQVFHNSAASEFWSFAPRNGGDLDIAVTTTDPRPTSGTIGTSNNAVSIKTNKDVEFLGNVGIKTASPEAPLHIVGDSTTTGTAFASSFDTLASTYKVGGVVVIDANRNFIGNELSLSNSAVGADLIVNTSTFTIIDGRVGIGTANPSKLLDVAGDVQFGCPTGMTSFGRGCVSGVRTAGTWETVLSDCKTTFIARICTYLDIQQACAAGAITSVGSTISWFGDHTGDNTVLVSFEDTCATNIDGAPEPTSNSRPGRCCL